VLLTQVQYVKSTPHKNFVIVDTGLHHLLRPALYSAHHRIENARVRVGAAKLFDVVGPICESSDVLGRDRMLVPPREGDVFAIFDVGAYGAAMMSRYNLHPPAREIFFRAGRELA
jgi:diaminopimelate decarboxylase